MKKLVYPVMLACTLLAAGCGTFGGDRKDGDNRTAGAVVDDALITSKVKAALLKDPDISGFKINVDTAKGVVSLKGEVKTLALRRKAESIASGVEGVRKVDNQLIITG
ncbi:BON domain-containing protein [Noviherbaspirillum aridicola]|uniref:Transporter n=1 Tax=Noviherbaspirillum aridicola TaxID=2849687 RepID=A0ABQ4Q970_9BURK|nr:BON domain-containing protein [Noviherbaspirillum aridicola]GIZ53745.1 transporter [Noviherbaspirillum aridicola]